MNNPPPLTLQGQWSTVSMQWNLLGAPLRPIEEDVCIIRDVVYSWTEACGRSPRALIMGVTPEYYDLPWPEHTTINAVDNNQAMIDHVWPGDVSQVKLDSWTTMDWPDNRFDIAMCDGGLQLLDYPKSQQQLVDRLFDIVETGGLIVLRLFSLPREQETPESVINDLLSGEIQSMNCLKIRLGTAMQEDSEQGVRLGDIWQYLFDNAGNWLVLSNKLGWSLDHVSAIDSYKSSPARYHFMSVEDVEALFCRDGKFTVKIIVYPSYNMGEQCPILVFEKS